MIIKFQQGGLAPLVSYQPVTVTGGTPSQAPTASSSQAKSGNDLTDDDLLKMLDKLDGLPSDMSVLINKLQNFYIDQKYSPDTSSIASRYLQLMGDLKIANHNKAEYDKAFEIVSKNGGLNEYAISDRGQLFCINSEGDFKLLSVDQLNENSDYTPLTNSELLYYRAEHPDMANKNNILKVVSNGIGIEAITKMIKDSISNLGSTSTMEEGYAKTKANTIIKGLDDFVKASQESGNAYNPTIENLYKGKLLTKSQATQAQQAFDYIWSSLPENAKTLLKIKSRAGENGAKELIQKLILSTTDNTSQFTFDLEDSSTVTTNSTNTKKTSGGFDMDPVSLLQAGYGQKETITIQTAAGGTRGIQVPTVRMPIVTKEGKSIGINATLADVSESGFAGYLNFENASMGGAMINTSGFNNIIVNGTALYTGDLPIDLEEYYSTGNIKPDIDMLGKYKEAQQYIAEQKITDKEEINKIYQEAGLPIMYGENGDVLTNYARFGMINAYALNSAFSESAEFADWLTEVNDGNTVQNILDILNKGRSDADKIDFDAKSGWDKLGWFLDDHDSLYQGTIFIPVNNDHFTATSGFGNYPSTSEAATIEANQQALERSKLAQNSYNNPGNQL